MNSSNRNGFFVVEFLVYLSIFALVSVFFLQFVFTTSLHIKKQCTELTHTLNYLTALDIMTHDISNSSEKKKYWLVTHSDHLVWHSKKEHKDVSYSIVKENLIRTTGNFDTIQKKWRSKSSNILVQALESVQFDYQWDEEQQKIITIGCTLRSKEPKKFTGKRIIIPAIRTIVV